ncbi:hypothetical protein [Marinobacter salarius]|uniref:Uncharacterized protein n=1 Tax=Marinobacter salarius TaxID=1420917 RepID=A0A1W6KFP6_9GAMM|nr:hypothetical protein [Marinobacter salarius]ARM86149.1 hypothetical protein MARSALSMR5_04129 [Marinobacter salarius]
MPKMGNYQYTVIHKKHNSAHYGNCEVCANPVGEMYHQTERREYERANGKGTGWTHFGCTDKFGHLECLHSIRRDQSRNRSVKAA